MSYYEEEEEVAERQDEVVASCKYSNFGFQPMSEHNHSKKYTDIVGVIYNPMIRRFLVLDTRGISSWNCFGGEHSRCLNFPKYQTRVLQRVIFCAKHRIYFAIKHDFTLQVYNKDFFPIGKMDNLKMRSVMHIVYNSKTDVLITAGMAGTTVWQYRRIENEKDKYESKGDSALVEVSHYTNVGGCWCTRVILLMQTQQLCFCSENDLLVYSCKDFQRILHISNAHSGTLTCAGFCSSTKLYVTGGMDNLVKVWGSGGGLIYTFRGHSQPVTSLVVYKSSSGLAITSSLDGTVKVWSLHAMELFCSLNLPSRGPEWMQMIDDKLLWCATLKEVFVYKFQPVAEFWSYTRCQVTSMHAFVERRKTGRIMVFGDDGSIRFFGSSPTASMALCTVLPPPTTALKLPLAKMSYSRKNNLLYMQVSPTSMWIYSTKTDPASRFAEWDIKRLKISQPESLSTPSFQSESHFPSRTLLKKPVSNVHANEVCTAICAISSSQGFQFSVGHGTCSARCRDLLLLGFPDGKISFMDQTRKAYKYFEMFVSKDTISDISFDSSKERVNVLSRGITSAVIQILILPELKHVIKIETAIGLSSYAFLKNTIACGHNDGSLEVVDVLEDDPDQLVTLKLEASTAENTQNLLNHHYCINDIKACIKQQLFASCSSKDGLIKVWNTEKILLSEIVLDNTLSCLLFLDNRANLLIGWKSHIYVIKGSFIAKVEAESSDDSCDQDSLALKDSSTKLNFLTNQNEVKDLQKDINSDSLKTKEQRHSLTNLVGIDDSTDSDDSTKPLSIVYASPVDSVMSFGKSSASKNFYSEWKFPELGGSPTPTPLPSVWSSDDESEEDIVEAVEEEEEEEEEEKKEVISATEKDSMEDGDGMDEDEKKKDLQAQGSEDDEKNAKKSDKLPEKSSKKHKKTTKQINSTTIKKQSKNIFSREKLSDQSSAKKLEFQKKSKPTLVAKKLVPPRVNRRTKFVESAPELKFQSGDKDDQSDKSGPVTAKVVNYGALGQEISLAKGPPIIGQFKALKNQGLKFGWTGRRKLQVVGDPTSSFASNSVPRGEYSGDDWSGSESSQGLLIERIEPRLKSTMKEQKSGEIDRIMKVYLRRTPITNKKSSNKEVGDKRNNYSDKKWLKSSDPLKSRQKTTSSGMRKRFDSDYSDFFNNFESTNIEVPIMKYDSTSRNDGLQFDEQWQDRLLERHLLLKKQRELRHKACALKREKLQNERKSKLFTRSPELAWTDGEENRYSSSKFMDFYGESPSSYQNIHPNSLFSFKSQCQDEEFFESPSEYRQPLDEFEQETNFRLSFRNSQSKRLHSWKRTSRAASPQSRCASKLLRSASQLSNYESKSFTSSSKLLVPERPRSSVSIPSRTRYVLVKPRSTDIKSALPPPSKLEEVLLRKRFPSQYQAMLRAMKKWQQEQGLETDQFCSESLNNLGPSTDESGLLYQAKVSQIDNDDASIEPNHVISDSSHDTL